ncbi:hypothetical protein B6U90_03485 [Thermoplasmatales archaeon ex4484_6]|nr:MAG: hypothetical protein B6U90_03485 [Thermoplasmatales archaeon ex4484_6]RLF67388.1 MAG: hypothetical protein DRN57_05790 [Thermoplasmata archaeon]
MSGWPLKDQARVAGIDDGPYIRGSKTTPCVITVARLDGYIEGFIPLSISTDGEDSAERISTALKGSRFRSQIRAVLSDGACLGGFNVLDLEELHRSCQVPIITCSDERPDDVSILEALKNHFDDWKERYDLITRWKVNEVELDSGPCFVRCEGTAEDRAEWIVRKATLRGRMPEPIRISHLVAGALFPKGGTRHG